MALSLKKNITPTITSILTSNIDRNYSTFNLHRWGNHLNTGCTERFDKCMSIKWNDYSCLSRDEESLKERNKEIDDKYGEQIKKRIKNSNSNKILSNQTKSYPIYKDKKSMYSYYVDIIEMRATMLF